MRTVGWVLLSAMLTAFALWVVMGPWTPRANASLAFTILLFTAHPLGAMWMLYHAIRFERKPVVYIILAFVPYMWLWYYFEHVRSARSQRTIEQS